MAYISTQASMLAQLPTPPEGKRGWPWRESSDVLPPFMPDGQPWPKITVVTPSYNQGRFIEETIRSVLLQNYPNLEYIIIDGGSTDATVEIIEHYALFLTFWVSEKDGGQANAINKGFARSTGSIMGWLNSDDLLKPNALMKIARTVSRKTERHVVTGFREVINERGELVRYWSQDLPTHHYLRHYCAIAQETTYWRRKIWDELGPLDESLHYALDYDYWLRIIQAGYEFTLMPHYTGMFRSYPDNKTNSLMNTVYVRDIQHLYDKYEMGANEREILNDLGWEWSIKYRYFQRLSYLPIMKHPRLIIFLLSALEIKVLLYALSLIDVTYRRFRFARGSQRSKQQVSLWRALLKAIPHGMLSTTNPRLSTHDKQQSKSLSPYSIRNFKQVDASTSHVPQPSTIENVQTTLSLRGNWGPLEYYRNEWFRWIDNDAEVVIESRPDHAYTLFLEVEPGRDLHYEPFVLQLIDNENSIVGEASVIGRQIVALPLPETIKLPVRFRLRAQGNYRQHSEADIDQRTLHFRVFQLELESAVSGMALPAMRLQVPRRRLNLKFYLRPIARWLKSLKQ